MKQIFYRVFIALGGFITIPIGISVANPDNIVQVSMSNHPRLTLTIIGDGSLSYENLPGIDITGALIHDNDHATCFFYRHPPYPPNSKWISDIIEYRRPLIFPFEKADRLYCYDSSLEQNDRNIFTLFLENRENEKQKVQLRLDEDVGYIELPVREAYPQFSVGLKVAVINQPKPPYMNAFDFPGCFVKMVGQIEYPFRYGFSLRYPSRELYSHVDKIVCFRTSELTEIKQRWWDENFPPRAQS